MAERSTFARRVRAAIPRAAKYEIRDDMVSGLVLAIQPTGVRTYFLARMVRGRRRYATIGNADAMTIPEARREALRLIGSYIEPSRKDNGPKAPGHALDETTERYVHLSDQSVADAADRVSNRIHAALAGKREAGG